MKNLFKSKFILSLLASSFVLATGLVSMSNVNSSFAMQKNDDEFIVQYNDAGSIVQYNNDNNFKKQAYENATGKIFECSDLKFKDIVMIEQSDGDAFYREGEMVPFNFRYNDGSWRFNQLNKKINYNTGGNGFSCYFVDMDEENLNWAKKDAYEHATGNYFEASGLSFEDISVTATSYNRLKFFIKGKDGNWSFLNIQYMDGTFEIDKFKQSAK